MRYPPTNGEGLDRHGEKNLFFWLADARRAHLALERGYSMLQVDASDDSRPILERLGLHTVGRTVPYVTA